MRWLNGQVNDGILGIIEGDPVPVSARKSWQRLYVDSGYKAGIRQSFEELGRASSTQAINSAFLSPIHVERVGLIYSRNFDALQGIYSGKWGEQISSVLARGLAEGQHPRVLARSITDRVSRIGVTRGAHNGPDGGH